MRTTVATRNGDFDGIASKLVLTRHGFPKFAVKMRSGAAASQHSRFFHNQDQVAHRGRLRFGNRCALCGAAGRRHTEWGHALHCAALRDDVRELVHGPVGEALVSACQSWPSTSRVEEQSHLREYVDRRLHRLFHVPAPGIVEWKSDSLATISTSEGSVTLHVTSTPSCWRER